MKIFSTVKKIPTNRRRLIKLRNAKSNGQAIKRWNRTAALVGELRAE